MKNIRHHSRWFPLLLLACMLGCGSDGSSGPAGLYGEESSPVDSPDSGTGEQNGVSNPEGEEPASSGQASFQVGQVSYRKQCLKTAGDVCSSQCDQCWSACGEAVLVAGSANCVEMCSSMCKCTSTSSDLCLSYGHVFDFGPADPGIEQACLDWDRALQDFCQLMLQSPLLCTSFASAERPEVAQAYACLAAEARSGDCDPTDSACSLPETDQGTRLCAQAMVRCGSCPIDPAALDHAAGWLREDVLEAAWKCLELPDCTDSDGCLEAWREQALAGL